MQGQALSSRTDRFRVAAPPALESGRPAGVATGVYSSHDQAIEQFVKRDRTFTPDAKRHAVYAERLAKYRALFPLMHDYLAHM